MFEDYELGKKEDLRREMQGILKIHIEREFYFSLLKQVGVGKKE